jgi:hypothetical protein
MAQTGYTTVQLYRTTTASATPTAGNLTDGELAINTTDEKLYFKNASGTVKLLAANVMPVANGGTGATTASVALTNLGAVAKAGDTMTGVLAFTAGTVSAPGITFSGDTNTGIFSPAADTIAFTEGGVESMRIDSSGNVGIGTSSPSTLAKLAVAGADDANLFGLSSTTGVLRARAYDTATTGAVVEATNAAQSAYANLFLNGLNLLLGTGGSERMRIDSSGNVGIGTSSPGERLVVQGSTGNVIAQIRNSSTVASTSKTTAVQFIGTDTVGTVKEAGDIFVVPGDNNYVDSNMLFYTRGSDTVTERMRINSSGNVGIGTSSPGAKLEVVGNIKIGGYNIIGGANNSTVGMFAGTAFNTGGASIVTRGISNGFNDGGIEFYTGSGATGSERMRITADGRIGIKTSVPTSLLTISTPGDTENITKLTINGYGDFRGYGCIMQPNNDTNCVPFLFTNAAGTIVGSISTNASGTSFTTSSDYRLKHDVQPLTTGLATIAALKPSTYKWNADDSHGEGFIAHELAEHIPHAVTGEKDAVNADGSIKPQAVDYSKIVVHLVAALQELKAESDALKARIATLEARQ